MDLQSQLRQALRAGDQVEVAVLFGSRARGDATPESDLDLALRAPGADLPRIGSELSRALAIETDIVDLDAVGYPLLRASVRDA